ncbi:MAG: pyridoxamine 5'-phosphate oxidase family protein [Gammaproteobacteria bacterium]|nr:pyridoxamine 5'-phosphate oxidase family protein [Gammaproteobacteria bacterium]
MAIADPVLALGADRQQARELADSNAELCWLATVDDAGWPQVRALVLRDVAGGFALFINATSAKGRQLQRDPRCQVACWYPSLQRQWRLKAQVRALDRTVLAEHWHRRPRSSQVLDHVYAREFPQSSPLADPKALHAAHGRLDASLGDHPDPPPEALALRLDVHVAECLQIHPGSRLHERWQFTCGEAGWLRQALVP